MSKPAATARREDRFHGGDPAASDDETAESAPEEVERPSFAISEAGAFGRMLQTGEVTSGNGGGARPGPRREPVGEFNFRVRLSLSGMALRRPMWDGLAALL